MNRLFPSTPLRGTVCFALALAVTAGACDCDSAGFRDAEPKIVVNPESFSIDGVPGRFTEHILKVSNEGSSALRVSSVELVDGAGAPHTKYAIVQQFVEDCEEQIRPAEGRYDILQSSCSIIRFRYLPTDDGVDTGAIIINSNDPDTPALRVPINGNSQTPDLEVCAYDGDTELNCNVPGGVLEVDFGISPPGTAVTRTLKLKSKGSREVTIEGMNLMGDGDFSVTPDTYSGSLEPGAEETLTVTFNALIGGSRDGRLVFRNNDPLDERLEVRLRAIGDGSKMCLCVENAAGKCLPTTVADFGRTPIGGTGKLNMRIASCGTKNLDLTTLTLDGAPLFGATFPTLPTSLAPTAPYIEIPMTFSPTEMVHSEGRINIVTSEEQGFVTLMGDGYESGCKLVAASSTIDFGSVAIGYTGEKKYTLANQGDEPCVVKGPNTTAPTEGAHISLGANVTFSLAAFPSQLIVPPSTTIGFTLAYKPADMTGPDVGEFTVPYSGESGSPIVELKVQLKGTPVAEPVCVLTAAPGGNTMFGRALNFGQVRIHKEKVMPVTFTNTGSANCKINNARIDGTGMIGMPSDKPYFKVKAQARTPLPPGQSTTVEIAFTPDAERVFGGELPFGGTMMPGGVSLLVNTDDIVNFAGGCAGFGGSGSDGCVSWGLSGSGAKSDLAALPGDLDFGLVTLGCNSREEIITLYNIGSLNATITDITLDPVENPAIFKVIHPPVPFTLSGGTPLQLKVKYRPSGTGIHTANIYISSDATNATSGDITVGLRGTGTTDTHVTDTFDQNTRPKTDVLFVVDDSGSMGEEQSALATNASRFITVAKNLNTDFHVGVVTTDTEVRPGQLRFTSPSPKVNTSDDVDPAADFARTVKALGTNGSATEKGLQSMVDALSPPNSTDMSLNGGFLRADAKLAVIIVSDEDDFSSGSVNFYTDFLKNIKGIHNQGLVTLSAIVGDNPSGCSSNNGAADAGSRYIAVQQATGGQFRSICSADWGQIAADLGLDAFGARAGFPLSRDAVETSIKVKLNGSSSNKPDWGYEVLPNSVVFTPAKLPDAGATVVIDYDAFCHTGF